MSNYSYSKKKKLRLRLLCFPRVDGELCRGSWQLKCGLQATLSDFINPQSMPFDEGAGRFPTGAPDDPVKRLAGNPHLLGGVHMVKSLAIRKAKRFQRIGGEKDFFEVAQRDAPPGERFSNFQSESGCRITCGFE